MYIIPHLVASEGTTYQYIVGIDREDIQLLCDPMNSSYKLDSLSWHVMSDKFANPINIFSSRNSLPETSTQIQCVSNSVTIRTNSIRVYGQFNTFFRVLLWVTNLVLNDFINVFSSSNNSHIRHFCYNEFQHSLSWNKHNTT